MLPSLSLLFKKRNTEAICLERLFLNKDLVAVLLTGFGKSLAFQVLSHLMKEQDSKTSNSNAVVFVLPPLGTFRSDYDYEYEYEFFNVYPVRMPDCVRLSRQLVLSSKSRRRLDTNYEIFNKSRPPTTSSLQLHSRVKRSVFKRADTL